MTGFRNALLGAAGAATGGYSVDNSIVLDDGSSQYLTRTPSAAGNLKTFTVSFWFKRGNLGIVTYLLKRRTAALGFIRINADDTLTYYNEAGGVAIQLITTQVFRDPHSWYHLVVVQDTTQATASDRAKMYLNGSEITAFNTAQYNIAQNGDGTLFDADTLDIGQASTQFWDGYLSEYCYIDGTALTETSFGEYDTNGVWRPIDIANAGLTFGNNGFYLPFTDANALGADESISGDVSGGQYETNAVDTSNTASSYTFSSQDIGTADADRQVIVSTVTGGGASGINFSGVTVGGVTANQLLYLEGNDNNDVAFWVANVTTGTTADVVVSVTGGTMEKCGIGIWTINSATGLSVYDSYTEAATSSTPSGSVSCPANGIVLAVSGVQGSAGVCTISYTGATEVFDATIESGANASHAGTYDEYSTAQTVTITATASAATNRNSLAVVALNGANNFKTSGSPTQSSDTCTNNVATLTPLGKNSDVTLSKGNLHCVGSGTNFDWVGSSMTIPSSGKWVFEGQRTTGTNGKLGIGDRAATRGTDVGTGEHFTIDFGGAVEKNGVNVTSVTAPGASVIRVEYDVDTDTIEFFDDGVSVYSGTAGLSPEDGILQFVAAPYASGSTEIDVVFNENDFTGTPTSGFLGLDTTNLYANAAPAIEDGTAHFQAIKWSGDNNAPRSLTFSGNSALPPDLMWAKRRNSSKSHVLVDEVRGDDGTAMYSLESDSSGAELDSGTTGTAGYFSSLDANGFTLDVASTFSNLNDSGSTYVGWGWKGDGTSGSSNTDGSIPSTVNVNDTAGFSIVKYTSTNGSGAGTLGHGLNSTPEFIICKSRDSAYSWAVYHKNLTSAGYKLILDQTNVQVPDTTTWNNTAPDPTVFSVGTDNGTNPQGSADNMVAYCFHSVPGYSAFGSYEGNGSSDGTLVLLDLKPAFVLLKKIDTTANDWTIWDNQINPSNLGSSGGLLRPNLPNVEQSTSGQEIDVLSNGFKIRNGNNQMNTSGKTYIYAAFAEYPFAGSSPATAR